MTIKDINNNFESMLSEVEQYNPQADTSAIKRAWEFAKLAHTGQKRLTGEPYVSHVLEVAIKLCEWRLDSTSIIAALLHDTIEDGGAKREDIVSEFGEEVAVLVDGVTKVTTLRLKGSKEKEFVENLRKMLLVMAKDLRVILVKLADRLHNLKTLYGLSRPKLQPSPRPGHRPTRSKARRGNPRWSFLHRACQLPGCLCAGTNRYGKRELSSSHDARKTPQADRGHSPPGNGG